MLVIYNIVNIITMFIFVFSPYNFRRKGKEVGAVIDYTPLWETMKKKEISQYRLLKGGIDNRTLDSLKKNGNITMLTLEKLCNILECSADDIVRFR